MKERTFMKSLIQITAVCLLVLNLPTLSFGVLSVESYSQLTKGIARLELDYLGELSVLTQKHCEDPNFFQAYCDDPNCFLEQKLIIEADFDSNEAVLLEAFSTTAEEYGDFGETDANAIEEYLNNNPSIAQTIDNLYLQIDELLNSRLSSPLSATNLLGHSPWRVVISTTM